MAQGGWVQGPALQTCVLEMSHKQYPLGKSAYCCKESFHELLCGFLICISTIVNGQKISFSFIFFHFEYIFIILCSCRGILIHLTDSVTERYFLFCLTKSLFKVDGF